MVTVRSMSSSARLAVEQLDVLRAAADLGRVDLEVEEEDVLRARPGPGRGRRRSSRPGSPRRRATGTSVFSVIPSTQPGSSTSVAASISSLGADREARHEEEAAAERARASRPRARRRPRTRCRSAAAGRTRSAGRGGRAARAAASTAQRTNGRRSRPDEVAVPLQGQLVRRRGHAEQFARRGTLLPGEAATLRRLRAPVAQGIERCPAEAEVARSNRAGRMTEEAANRRSLSRSRLATQSATSKTRPSTDET